MPIRVLGWDVGIKNLAFCLVESNKSEPIESAQIKSWEIINLCETREYFCVACKKKAKYYLPDKYNKKITDSTETFCGVHMKDKDRKMIKKPKIKRDLRVFGLRLKTELDAHKSKFLSDVDMVVIY